MEPTNIYDLIIIILILTFFGTFVFIYFKSAVAKEILKLTRINKFLEDYINKLNQEIEERAKKDEMK